MKHMKKHFLRSLSVLLSITMMLSCVIPAFAAGNPWPLREARDADIAPVHRYEDIGFAGLERLINQLDRLLGSAGDLGDLLRPLKDVLLDLGKIVRAHV